MTSMSTRQASYVGPLRTESNSRSNVPEVLQGLKGITRDCPCHCLVENVFSLPFMYSDLSFTSVLLATWGLQTMENELCVTGFDSLVQFVCASLINTFLRGYLDTE